MNKVLRCTLIAVMMLTAFHQYSSAQNSEWFCPGCGYKKPVDGVLFFDDMLSEDPSEKWCVAELKDFENSGLGIDGTLKVEYSGQPEVLYAIRQGYKVIATTPVKCKPTWNRLHWDAFHEHSHEDGHAGLYLDGESIAGCPEQHRKEGDNHVGFQAGTNPKYFCIRNVKINDESAD